MSLSMLDDNKFVIYLIYPLQARVIPAEEFDAGDRAAELKDAMDGLGKKTPARTPLTCGSIMIYTTIYYYTHISILRRTNSTVTPGIFQTCHFICRCTSRFVLLFRLMISVLVFSISDVCFVSRKETNKTNITSACITLLNCSSQIWCIGMPKHRHAI